MIRRAALQRFARRANSVERAPRQRPLPGGQGSGRKEPQRPSSARDARLAYQKLLMQRPSPREIHACDRMVRGDERTVSPTRSPRGRRAPCPAGASSAAAVEAAAVEAAAVEAAAVEAAAVEAAAVEAAPGKPQLPEAQPPDNLKIRDFQGMKAP